MKCSVVIPLYNRRELIRRAVDSVLAQTRGDFELLVVDDGSTDHGADAIRALGDERLRIIERVNGGESAARNTGIAEARGPWVAFLDSDDEWSPRFLERTLALADGGGPALDAVFTNLRSTREGAPWLRGPFAGPEVLEDYFKFALRHEGRGMTSSSSLVRRKAIVDAGGFPVGVHRSGDVDTWLRVALAGRVGFVPEVLSSYHNETRGSARLFPEPVYPEGVKTLRRRRRDGRIPERYAASLRRLEALYLLIYARDLIECGARERARRVLLREVSWRHCPPACLAKAVIRACSS